MLPSGLEVVSNPSEMFRRDHNGNLNSEHLTGLAVAVVMDGTQTFLLEIQVLRSNPSLKEKPRSNVFLLKVSIKL